MPYFLTVCWLWFAWGGQMLVIYYSSQFGRIEFPYPSFTFWFLHNESKFVAVALLVTAGVQAIQLRRQQAA